MSQEEEVDPKIALPNLMSSGKTIWTFSSTINHSDFIEKHDVILCK